MKKLIVLIFGLVVLIPSLAFSDMMTFRLGYYMPYSFTSSYLSSHPDSLFAIEINNMSFVPSDFRGSILGVGYEFFLTRQLSFAISADFFSHETGGFYKGWVGINLNTTGFQGEYAFPYPQFSGQYEIQHSLDVSMYPVQFSLKFTPLGRKTRIIPYVGAGAGVYFLNVAVRGEMPDFNAGQAPPPPYQVPTIYPVVLVDAHETRVVLGGHAFAGIMVPIGYRLTLEAEARYHYARANFRSAFPASDYGPIDLSGLSLSIGLNYWF
jgi:hypothetical protein